MTMRTKRADRSTVRSELVQVRLTPVEVATLERVVAKRGRLLGEGVELTPAAVLRLMLAEEAARLGVPS
jgi:hypothetical protein